MMTGIAAGDVIGISTAIASSANAKGDVRWRFRCRCGAEFEQLERRARILWRAALWYSCFSCWNAEKARRAAESSIR